jgi:hypothetical protein
MMLSTVSSKQFAWTYDAPAPEKPKSLKSRAGERLDEIAVFALFAVAIFYIAAASCWFIF